MNARILFWLNVLNIKSNWQTFLKIGCTIRKLLENINSWANALRVLLELVKDVDLQMPSFFKYINDNFNYNWLVIRLCSFKMSRIRPQSNCSLTLHAARVKEPVTRSASQRSQNDESLRSSQTITVQFGAQLHANYHSAPGRMQRVMSRDSK